MADQTSMTARIGDDERQAVLTVAQRLSALGLTIGDSGNVSARVPEINDSGRLLVAITPHGRYYDELSADDIPVVDQEGEPVVGDAIPSVELMLHVAIYQARPDVGGVIHAHAPWSSAAAVAGRPLAPILEDQVIYLGGQIEVARHATTGSDELPALAIAALGERNACLLANHGALAVGKSVKDALVNCQYLEKVAFCHLMTQAIGQTTPLSPEAVAAGQAFFRMR